MKKMILLLLLPLTVLMAIDFTMTEKGLFAETTTQDPAPGTESGAANPYLEPVDLPKCDASNPDVQFIRNNSDWKTINSSSKRIFCVSPGDYRSLGNIKLTANGTADKKRYIVLNNGNDTHPGKLTDPNLAFYSLELNNADYWVIDRAAYKGTSSVRIYKFVYGADHNILNRSYIRDFATAVFIGDGSHNNTIQKCRIQDQTHNSRKSDVMAILLIDYPLRSKWVEIKNTKIIANEVKNCNDALHMARNPLSSEVDRQDGNMEGTIVDGNHMYITSDIYTDGKGNYTPNGNYAYAENAIDIKIGSDNPDNPLIVTNNLFWGYRKSDTTGSLISSTGTASVFHFGVKNAKINDNVIFDSAGSIIGSDNRDQPYGLENAEIKRNLIVDCGKFSMTESANLDIQDNKFFNGQRNIAEFMYNTQLFFGNNDIINVKDERYLLVKNSLKIQGLDTNNIFTAAEDAGYTDDYVFFTDKFTNKARKITLENTVIKTNSTTMD